MTTYKELKGTQIEAVSSDPSNPIEGQVWYNTTDNVLKGEAAIASSSWATGGNLNNARASMSNAGIQTSALGTGGYGNPPAGVRDFTELYNGTNWTEVNDLNTARQLGSGAGASSTSALAFGS